MGQGQQRRSIGGHGEPWGLLGLELATLTLTVASSPLLPSLPPPRSACLWPLSTHLLPVSKAHP